LKSALRPEDLIARLGGDEFAIVFNAGSDEDIAAAAEKIFEALQHPLAHHGLLLECNASIGASLYPRDGTERSELMKAADIALYAAKSGGRGQLKIFKSAMRNHVQSRSSMIFLARRALGADDVLPHYQPKVSLRDGQIVGFEALLRWRDSNGRLRLPEDVKAAFEDPVLAAALSKRMIGRTLADIRRWLDAGLDFGHVAINVAASEFRSGRFAEDLLEKLEQEKIAPRHVQIEVTETVFLGRGAGHVGRALRQLSEAGLRIALDDFGTGYASLAHLMQFPVDALKIDQSFVRGIGSNSDAEEIIKAIVNLGQSLGIEVIAEGVETRGQEAHLIGLGCKTGQGFLYSKAAPSGTISRMLAGVSVPVARFA
jgi:predicted signal transduction protein with EAL and GGDEF domain